MTRRKNGGRAGRLFAAMALLLVCLTPPVLMLAPPSEGEMLAIYAPGLEPADTLLAAIAAGASAAEPLAGGMLVRADMPAGLSGAGALRAHGALLVIAPVSGWACPPGTPARMEWIP